MDPSDVAPMVISIIFTLAVTTIILVWMQKRVRPKVEISELRAIAERLERMEQAIDAMAVETERISEGQRFTTKLLSERSNAPVPRA